MRAALPLAAAALLGEGRAASRQWAPSADCPVVTPSTWVKAACWSPPGPPPSADNDTVTFDSTTTAIMVNTSSSNITVEAIVVPNLVISNGTTVALVQGTLELRGAARVYGTLELVGAPNWGLAQGTSNEEALQVDTKARALGLRDCAYIPVGFTPRLCGPGVWGVEKGGVLDVHGMYASVFSDVQVKMGGYYHFYRGAHLWGLIENWGTLTTDPIGCSAIHSIGCVVSGRDDCLASGCCWDPPADACADASEASCGFASPPGADQCAAAGCCHRPARCNATGTWSWAAPCGPAGASEEDCLARGCCWNASAGQPNAYTCTYNYDAPTCLAPRSLPCYSAEGPGIVYWHGMLDNKAGGVFHQWGTMYFDEYTHDEGSAPVPEKFNQEAFRNAGKMSITGELLSTFYMYYFGNFSGVYGWYSPSLLNVAGGTMSISGLVTSALSPVNHGTWAQIGHLNIEGGFNNTGRLSGSGSLACTNLIVNSGNFSFRGSLSGGSFVNSGTVNSTGLLNLANAINNTGSWASGGLAKCRDIVNTGTMTADSGMLSANDMTNYNYFHGTSYDFGSLTNLGRAELRPAGPITNNATVLMLPTDSFTQHRGLVVNNPGARILFPKGAGMELHELRNAGDILVDGCQLWVSSLTCINCNFYLSENAELHFQAPHQGHTPRVLLADLPPSRGTPKVCTAGACVEDPCPYAVSHFGPGNVSACTFAGDKGPLPGVMAYGTCYACAPWSSRGLLGDKKVIAQLVREARRRGGGGDGPAPDAAALSSRRHHFEGGTVRSDGTGSLVMQGAVHLFGRKALRVHNTRVHTVLEWGFPALLGGGTLTLRQRSVLRLGVNAVLDEGGSIVAEPGTAVVVDGHASVSARNHSLHIAPKASVRVDGQLYVGARSVVRTCGANIGSGGVTFDDATYSAVACAAPGDGAPQCLSDCQTDADCSAAGSCTWCSKAHGGAAAVGSCTEPRGLGACSSGADCAHSGACVGGVCASCGLETLPRSGADCSRIPLGAAAPWGQWTDVSTGKPLKGDVIGAEWVHMDNGYYATASPSACPGTGGPDDMIISVRDNTASQGQQTYPGLVLAQAQHLTPLTEDGNSPLAVRVYFDYSWPRTSAGCSYNYTQCVGTCPGGGPCGMTSASGCGCPAQCAPRGTSPAACGTRIATAPTARDLGNCGPDDSCWCGRDGQQSVLGTKACPSAPRAVKTGNDTVLLFYNMGDGKGIGLAAGPAAGPWQVVREPLFPAGTDAVQDPFVYKDRFGWHMLLTGGGQKNVRAAYSEDGKNWTLLPRPALDLEGLTAGAGGPNFTSVARPRVYSYGTRAGLHALTWGPSFYRILVDAATVDNPAVRPWSWDVHTDWGHWI